MEALTLAESNRLIQLEKVVTAGLQSWIEVGEALIEIRDSRLYKIEAATFEEYCQNKFKMGRKYADRLISAAPIARELTPTGVISERAIREIAKVEPERRQEIFDKATDASQGHVPTARLIKQIVSLDDEKEEVEQEQPYTNQGKIIIDHAEELWVLAKSYLDNISKDDASRVRILKEVISYAENRLAKKR